MVPRALQAEPPPGRLALLREAGAEQGLPLPEVRRRAGLVRVVPVVLPVVRRLLAVLVVVRRLRAGVVVVSR